MSWLDDLESRVNELLDALERCAVALERIADAAERAEIRELQEAQHD